MSSSTSIDQVGKEEESFKIIFCQKSSSHCLLNFMCLFNYSLVFPQNYKIKNIGLVETDRKSSFVLIDHLSVNQLKYTLYISVVHPGAHWFFLALPSTTFLPPIEDTHILYYSLLPLIPELYLFKLDPMWLSSACVSVLFVHLCIIPLHVPVRANYHHLCAVCFLLEIINAEDKQEHMYSY